MPSQVTDSKASLDKVEEIEVVIGDNINQPPNDDTAMEMKHLGDGSSSGDVQEGEGTSDSNSKLHTSTMLGHEHEVVISVDGEGMVDGSGPGLTLSESCESSC